MEEYIIETENLSFSYEEEGEFSVVSEIPALKDVSIKIRSGEYVSVLGHNGSGKSTFAKLLNLILTPTKGKVYIDGKDVSVPDLSDDDLFEVRSKIGMVFQNPDNQIVATVESPSTIPISNVTEDALSSPPPAFEATNVNEYNAISVVKLNLNV